MADLSDADWEELTRDLSARVAAFAPDWTDYDSSDPGVTLIAPVNNLPGGSRLG